jgi:hypothetical protein
MQPAVSHIDCVTVAVTSGCTAAEVPDIFDEQHSVRGIAAKEESG